MLNNIYYILLVGSFQFEKCTESLLNCILNCYKKIENSIDWYWHS